MSAMHSMPSNPFSTRFTQPGRVRPLDNAGRPVDAAVLLERLRHLGGIAAIVGPHGSGKSTLLVHLAQTLAGHGRDATTIRLRSDRDLPLAWAAIRRTPAGGIACIDSWECLCRPVRGFLRLAAGLSGRGLLVTSHVACGLPVLVRCSTSVVLLRAVVAQLPGLGAAEEAWIREADIDEAFKLHAGNLRESLYDLYDRFEVRRGGRPGRTGGGCDGRDDRVGVDREIHEFLDRFSYAGAPERNLGLGR